MRIEVRTESLKSALHREKQPKIAIVGGFKIDTSSEPIFKVGSDGVSRGKIAREREVVVVFDNNREYRILPLPSKIEKLEYVFDPDSGGH